MRLGAAFLALGGLAMLASGCQTSSNGTAPLNEAKLMAAGFASQSAPNLANPLAPGTTVQVDSLYSCEATKCGSKVILLQLQMPKSNGMFGMTMEEAIKKKLLKDSTWEDILAACLKGLQQKVTLVTFRQLISDNGAGAEFEISGTDDKNRTVYGIGRLTFKGNSGDVTTAMSADRSVAKRSFRLLSGK